MIFKRVSLSLMKFMTGALCFFAILFSTPWGAQLTAYVISKTTPIDISYKSGSILHNLMLSQLSVKNDQVSTHVNNIHLQLHLRCLWKNQLCIDEFSIGSVAVSVKDNNTASAETLIEDVILPSLPNMPISIEVKHFLLNKLQINNQHLAINLTDFSTALSMGNKGINIEKTTLALAKVTLLKVNKVAAKVTKIPQAAQVKKTAVKPLTHTHSKPWPLATLPKVYLPFKLSVQSVAVNTLIVDESVKSGDDKTLVHLNNVAARLSWFKTRISLDKLSTTVIMVSNNDVSDDVVLSGNVDLSPPYRLDLAVTNAIKSSELWPEINRSTQKILFKGDLSQLAVTASSEGSLVFNADLSIDMTNANLPYNFNTNVTKFTLPNELPQQIKPSMLSLQSEGDLSQQTLMLQSELSGFDYQDVDIDLVAEHDKGTLTINSLNLQDRSAANMLMMNGKLTFGQKLSWDISVNSSGITLPSIDERIFGRLEGNINSKGFWYEDKWLLKLTNSAIKGEINDLKINANADVEINHQGKLSPSEIVIDYGDIALKLKGYSDEKWHVNGTATIGNTRSWLNNIESDVSTKISVSGSIQEPKLTLNGELNNIIVAEIVSDKILFDAVYQPKNNHAHQISITSSQLNIKEHIINNVNLSSKGDLNQQLANFSWSGDSTINLLVDSRYSPALGQWNFKTSNTAFTLNEYAFEANKPIELVYNEPQKSLHINKHCWQVNSSELCLTDNSLIREVKGKLPLTVNVDTTLLNAYMPKDVFVASSVAGRVVVNWQQQSMPTVDADLFLRAGHMQVNENGGLHKLLAWEKGRLTIQVKDDHGKSLVNGNLALTSLDGIEKINIGTAILLANSQEEDAQESESRIMDSHISIKDLDLSPLQAFIPQLSLLEGSLNSDITVTGNLTSPAINGQIAVTAGKTKISGDINTLEDINLTLEFKGQQALVTGGLNINTQLTTLSGDADWQSTLQANLNVDGEALNISIPPDLTLTVSPHLKAQLSDVKLKILGQIDVLEGKLSVDKLPQGSVSLSKDAIIVGNKEDQIVNEKRLDVSTNIRIAIADTFKIEGQGFIGKIGGDLQVSQSSNYPFQLFGNLKIPEGRYRAYGQDLSITKGNIAFSGPVNNPYVSMQATRNIEKEDIVVGVDATGSASNLTVKLFSRPTMQQSEVLSYLVRGRGLDAEASGGGTAIGMVVGTAVTNYSGVLTQIEKLPLVNRIEIDGDDEQASIAGYLGDQVYIKYGIGVVEPINELTVRFYIYSRLWLETVSGLESSANIYYSFDIK